VDPSAFRGAAASERWALRHHAAIALDATIECLAPVLGRLGAPVDRLNSSIASISVGVPQQISLRSRGWCDERASRWPRMAHPIACAFEMREMTRNHSAVPVGRGDIGRETFDAVRAADRGDLRLGLHGVAPALQVAVPGM
jgi:hypothetical protein